MILHLLTSITRPPVLSHPTISTKKPRCHWNLKIKKNTSQRIQFEVNKKSSSWLNIKTELLLFGRPFNVQLSPTVSWKNSSHSSHLLWPWQLARSQEFDQPLSRWHLSDIHKPIRDLLEEWSHWWFKKLRVICWVTQNAPNKEMNSKGWYFYHPDKNASLLGLATNSQQNQKKERNEEYMTKMILEKSHIFLPMLMSSQRLKNN